MAWRGLHLSRRTQLSLADNQIVARQQDGEVRVAIEDTAWIVLDTAQVTLSTALISGVTDRQYGRMHLLLGEAEKTEAEAANQMVLL